MRDRNQIWDVIPTEAGEARIKDWSRTPNQLVLYYKVDISDKASVTQSMQRVLEDFPKGSFAGAVHAAAANKSRPWSNSMMDSLEDFKTVLMVNCYGTFLIDACVADASQSLGLRIREHKIVDVFALPSQFAISR